MINYTNFNRAKDIWDRTDKDMLGEEDLPDIVKMLDDLFKLCQHYQNKLGGNSNADRSTALDS